MKTPIKRRTFLKSAAAIPAALVGTAKIVAAHPGTDDFQFEVTRSEDEWHEMLSDFEFGVLREGKTESQRTSALWNETRQGAYYCRGCDLHVYDAIWKVSVEKGWVFFRQNVPNSVLMGIDNNYPTAMSAPEGSPFAAIEAHCRRCGSHLGHVLNVEGSVLHCTNGTSFRFELAEA